MVKLLNKAHRGLALDLIKQLPDESINSIVTSPPYWKLRDYGYSDQWGLEPTFNEYLSNLWLLMDEIKRVLKPNGTVWFNLSDTYSNKSLLLLPHRFAIGCIDKGWKIRNDIVWAIKNRQPESAKDRFSRKKEYIFLMTKQDKYFFDLNSIKDSLSEESIKRYLRGMSNKNKYTKFENNQSLSKERKRITNPKERKERTNELRKKGKNPGDVDLFWDEFNTDLWDVPNKGTKSNHYAAYPEHLIKKIILAGCPKDGIILDPFCGTSTTGISAISLGRNYIGFDGSDEYVDISNERLKKQINNKTKKLF